MLTEIQRKILRLYGHRHRSGKSELLHSPEVADVLETTQDIVNDELIKLQDMGLLHVNETFGGNWSASIMPTGLRVLDEIGPIANSGSKK